MTNVLIWYIVIWVLSVVWFFMLQCEGQWPVSVTLVLLWCKCLRMWDNVCVPESLCRFSPYMSLTQQDKPSHSATNTHTLTVAVYLCVHGLPRRSLSLLSAWDRRSEGRNRMKGERQRESEKERERGLHHVFLWYISDVHWEPSVAKFCINVCWMGFVGYMCVYIAV